jgi:hypothetical protein
MAELVYRTTTRLTGPWLLDSTSLERLDKIIDELSPRLEEAQEAIFRERVQKEVNERLEARPNDDRSEVEAKVEKSLRQLSYYISKKRELSLTLKGDKTLRLATFKEAERHPEVQNGQITDFSMLLKCGEIKCELTTWSDDQLSLDVSPAEAETSREIYTAIRGWAKSVEPSAPLHYWAKLSGLQWILYFVILWLMAIYLSTGTSRWKGEARSLLDHGINSPTDQAKATELLLKIAAEYSDPSERSTTPPWFKLFLIAGAIICVMATFQPPKILVGLGVGEKKLKRWRWWIKFAFVSVPIFLLTTLARMLLQRIHF